jgi:hypothetical protein
LAGDENEQLMNIPKMYHKAFGYSMDDFKGISPSIATHRKFMEEGAQPVTKFSRRLKPEMKQVVRKEIIHLLDAGIIYHMAESDWVSHVHCVAKNGGFTIVANENNELVLTLEPLLGIECVLIIES